MQADYEFSYALGYTFTLHVQLRTIGHYNGQYKRMGTSQDALRTIEALQNFSRNFKDRSTLTDALQFVLVG